MPLTLRGIEHVKLIDATPIGINVRSTVATYAGIHDDLRKLYAKLPEAKAHEYKAGAFSYNTGSLRCQGCDGTGVVSLDVQFFAGRGYTLPGLPRFAVREGGLRYQADERGGGKCFAAGVDGYGRKYCS